MFLCWILGNFNIQIQKETEHKFMQMMYVSLKLKTCSIFISQELWSILCVTTKWQTFKRSQIRLILSTFSSNKHLYDYCAMSPNFNIMNMISNLLLSKIHCKNSLIRPIYSKYFNCNKNNILHFHVNFQQHSVAFIRLLPQYCCSTVAVVWWR